MHDSQSLLARAHEDGFELAGICDVVTPPHFEAYESWIRDGAHGTMTYLERHIAAKRNPESLLPGAKSVLVVGLMYHQSKSHKPGDMRIANYALGRDYHKVLRTKLKRICSWLQNERPGMQTRICVDSAPLMERDFGQMAGLGWFGKNTMLINSVHGSYFVLGEILLSERFTPSESAVGGCGTCSRCIDACPTGAITFSGNRWQVDARRCVSYLTIEHRGEIPAELSSKMGDWTFGCDVCQDVCPFNQQRASQPLRAAETQEPDFREVRDWPNLADVELLSLEEWDKLTAGSPVRRAGFDGLKRNARISRTNFTDVS